MSVNSSLHVQLLWVCEADILRNLSFASSFYFTIISNATDGQPHSFPKRSANLHTRFVRRICIFKRQQIFLAAFVISINWFGSRTSRLAAVNVFIWTQKINVVASSSRNRNVIIAIARQTLTRNSIDSSFVLHRVQRNTKKYAIHSRRRTLIYTWHLRLRKQYFMLHWQFADSHHGQIALKRFSPSTVFQISQTLW